jgi:colanic acid/amylovoran biosynthesis glycosyltransferase
MRVAYVTMQFPVPSETFAANDIRQHTRTGIEIEVFGLRPPHRDTNRLLVERKLVSLRVSSNGVRASSRGLAAALLRPQLLLRTLRWIWRSNRSRPEQLAVTLVLLPRAFDILSALERRRPDIVHIFWGHYPTVVGYLVQQRLPDVPVSVALNAYDLTMRYGGAVEVVRRADFVRTLAEVNVADVARHAGVPAGRIEVIYNGVDLGWLDSIAGRFAKIPRRIAVAGRLIASKGMDDVLRVFARIRASWPDATLVVMGDGPEKESLVREARSLSVADAVTFLGHVPHARVVEELAKAEVFLFLSRKDSERLPNVVKEGMACRCICVTTETPGIGELIESGRSGFVVRAGDIEGTAAAVEEILSGRVDTLSMTERARRHVEEVFDLEVTTDRYRRRWSSLLESGRGVAPGRPGRPTGAVMPLLGEQPK